MVKRLLSIIFAFVALTANAQEIQSPQYPGGEIALREFIESNLQCPPSVTEHKAYGTVYVRVEINKKGKPTKVEVTKASAYPDMDAEAVRVVKLIKEWQPGIKNGKPLASEIIVPVDFQRPENVTASADDIYPGGEEEMLRFFKMNTHYPQDALENHIYGTIYVHMTIDREGKSKDVRVTAPSEYPSLDAEAVRLVKLVKQWNPAKVNGEPYETDFVVPVEFVLPSSLTVDTPEDAGASNMSSGQNTSTQPQTNPGGTTPSTSSQHPNKTDGGEPATSTGGQNNQSQAGGTTTVSSTGITTTTQGGSGNGGRRPASGRISKMAQYPGGASAMYAFLSKNTKYPDEEKRKGVQGQVVVKFIVDESGRVTNPSIQKGLTTNCNAEAIRVVKSMPRWQPAEDTNGNKVAMEMTATVYFSINKPND